ncbi:hypothetical protein CALVIDRAFT_543047 [Calocera viscosa TUFC12733]|uniref:Uncharacterized protein n=1 Tax=Calocera viscosa (strain TUFC12733) TaxID=1330018 RepID=A0A167G0N1_CALVF|nr:hypothetical protein CALVIDRAFT_543047 [Calocera viscosa TUFC12733]
MALALVRTLGLEPTRFKCINRAAQPPITPSNDRRSVRRIVRDNLGGLGKVGSV